MFSSADTKTDVVVNIFFYLKRRVINWMLMEKCVKYEKKNILKIIYYGIYQKI